AIIPVPTRSIGSSLFLIGAALPIPIPGLYIGLILLLVFAGVVLWLLLVYVNSVFRFILFDSVVAKRCEIRRNWGRRQGPGFRYFVWQILVLVAMVMGLTILVGIPAAFALALGWLTQPSQHM